MLYGLYHLAYANSQRRSRLTDERVSSRGFRAYDPFRLKMIGFLSVNILKVLGEGGFSFVYLAQDEHSGVSRVHF